VTLDSGELSELRCCGLVKQSFQFGNKMKTFHHPGNMLGGAWGNPDDAAGLLVVKKPAFNLHI